MANRAAWVLFTLLMLPHQPLWRLRQFCLAPIPTSRLCKRLETKSSVLIWLQKVLCWKRGKSDLRQGKYETDSLGWRWCLNKSGQDCAIDSRCLKGSLQLMQHSKNLESWNLWLDAGAASGLATGAHGCESSRAVDANRKADIGSLYAVISFCR